MSNKLNTGKGNREVSSSYVKFVDGKNVETIIFKDYAMFSNIVISSPLLIV